MKVKISGKILSFMLAAVLMLALLSGVTVYGEDGGITGESGIITVFDVLLEDTAAQGVTLGTAREALNLPETLAATVSSGEALTLPAQIPVVWQSTPEYNGGSAGVYVFTASIPGKYSVAEGVAPPFITVTVGAQLPGITFSVAEDEYGSTFLYLAKGVALTEADLLEGVSAVDENNNPITVTLKDAGGLNMDSPAIVYPATPYTITFTAQHPATGEVFTATREVYVTEGTVMPATIIGDFEVTGDNGYSYAPGGRRLEITGDGTYTISMKSGVTSTTDSIVVLGGGNSYYYVAGCDNRFLRNRCARGVWKGGFRHQEWLHRQSYFVWR